jgi:hypothetical protein
MPAEPFPLPTADFHADFSQSGAFCEGPKAGAPAASRAAQTAIDHPCRVCPTCGNQLSGRRCKLECTQCGYYMSCADYY